MHQCLSSQSKCDALNALAHIQSLKHKCILPVLIPKKLAFVISAILLRSVPVILPVLLDPGIGTSYTDNPLHPPPVHLVFHHQFPHRVAALFQLGNATHVKIVQDLVHHARLQQ